MRLLSEDKSLFRCCGLQLGIASWTMTQAASTTTSTPTRTKNPRQHTSRPSSRGPSRAAPAAARAAAARRPGACRPRCTTAYWGRPIGAALPPPIGNNRASRARTSRTSSRLRRPGLRGLLGRRGHQLDAADDALAIQSADDEAVLRERVLGEGHHARELLARVRLDAQDAVLRERAGRRAQLLAPRVEDCRPGLGCRLGFGWCIVASTSATVLTVNVILSCRLSCSCEPLGRGRCACHRATGRWPRTCRMARKLGLECPLTRSAAAC